MLIRFPSIAGISTALTGTLRGKLDAIRAAILRGEDGHRSTRSMLELLLHEMQHPKQVLYEGPDTAIPAGGVYLSPWIDTNLWRWVAWYIANTGQNVTTLVTAYWSEDPAGAAPFIAAAGTLAAVPAPGCWYSQYGGIVAAGWNPSTSTPFAARYLRLYATSALTTTGRVKIVGMR